MTDTETKAMSRCISSLLQQHNRQQTSVLRTAGAADIRRFDVQGGDRAGVFELFSGGRGVRTLRVLNTNKEFVVLIGCRILERTHTKK